MTESFVLWVVRAPFAHLWDGWSKALTLLSTMTIFGGIFGVVVDGRSAFAVLAFPLLLAYGFLRSVHELHKSRAELEERLRPSVRIEAAPIRRVATPEQESQYAVVRVINISPAVRVAGCYGRITAFDQILEDGRILRNVGLTSTASPTTQGSDHLDDVFSPVVLQWSANESDGKGAGARLDFQTDAALDVAVIEGSSPSFLMLVTANPQLRNQFKYLFNLKDQHYRLVIEVAADESTPVRKAFKLVFEPRGVTEEAQLRFDELENLSGTE